MRQIGEIKDAIEEATADAQEEADFREGIGIQIEFVGFDDVELAFESLARERSGIELSNVRRVPDGPTLATVFVPHGKLGHFERVFIDYLTDKRGKRGQSLDQKALVNTIREVRVATLKALWTDDVELFPSHPQAVVWWEVWVRTGRDEDATDFRERAEAVGIEVSNGQVAFPERTVVLARASAARMADSMLVLNSVGELRSPKETADFFDSLPPDEQPEWVHDLLSRSRFPHPGAEVPHVCLLDTGATRGHPLLDPALDPADMHAVEPAWGVADTDGHGTEQAGLALTGDLSELLGQDDPVTIGHRLESVKILRRDRDHAGTNGEFHAHLTVEAVARPEITAPTRRRVFGLAVTSRDNRDRGRPSVWSAAVDRLACDAGDDDRNPRLIVVSAGNLSSPEDWKDYPHSNALESVHDPAQAWNALCIGAYTEKTIITEDDAEGYEPVADRGGLSPFSTTSRKFGRIWPTKPDLLMEGGNVAGDGTGPVWFHSLSLLTTSHLPTQRLFTTTRATSAATALAARMAAQILVEYPDLWAETVRGLLVHSAEWTTAMRSSFLPATARPTMSDYDNLVRMCGFGVPDLDRARWSLSNSLCLVSEQELQPFKKVGNASPTLHEMHLHELPWPKDELEALGETQVEMRVTLSYFVEPNPSGRGIRSKYRYPSHGLRFDVMRPQETIERFRRRVNAEAREEDEDRRGSGPDDGWTLGIRNRHRGSIHSDTWRGMAAELASRGAIAVYPTTGWWKTRPHLRRFNDSCRYSLIVSIRAPEVAVDLYSAVANLVGVPVVVET